jgi:signal transduction histidine kinase
VANESEEAVRAALVAGRRALAAANASPGGAAATASALREIDAAIARIDAGGGSAPKKDLLSIICHDLKDPLASIVMGAGFLKRALPEGDESAAPARRVALAILRASERMNHVIGDFHDLGKLEAGRIVLEPRPQEIGSLLHAAADQAGPVARARNVTLALDVADGEARAVCDRARVLQMLQKLVENAVRYSPEGGTVTLRAAKKDGRAWLAVSDSGKGVPDARKPTIFDRETNAAQTPRDGPGLGLAIVRELAVLHGGEVGVKDNAGPGATFWLTLPLG